MRPLNAVNGQKGFISLPAEPRFWMKVHRTEGCWLWRGGTDKRYGVFWLNRKKIKAHRYSLLLSGREIPAGMLVCHHCDNTLCVRPDHLFVGDMQANVSDMINKGRHGSVSKPTGVPSGEKNGNAKLTTSDVIEILRLRKQGLTYEAIAAIFGTTGTNIGCIVQGKELATSY